MRFRTKFVAAIVALAVVASLCAGSLILSAQRSELNQIRTTLAYESLSGYFKLYGAVFRTFKQARRDLVSGSGRFQFDLDEAERRIDTTLVAIETASAQESRLVNLGPSYPGLDNVLVIREEIEAALTAIRAASNLILSGQIQEGRSRAIKVLEGRVDSRIADLIEKAIASEQTQLEAAQNDIRQFHAWIEILAWVSVVVALALSVTVLLTLGRRFSGSLKVLDRGAKQYAADNLSHVIDLPGNDELSGVANRFNEMAQQLQTKKQALEQSQQDLERRVDERTQALSELNETLQDRDRMRRQFFADIGHELRTPVTAIRGEAEVALRARTDGAATRKAALGTIVSLSEQLTENVNDLFLIAREQAGVLDFRTHVLDLNGCAAAGVAQMQSLVAGKDASLAEHLRPSAIDIEGDGVRIAQLVRILITNALSHAQSGVEIDVSTFVKDHHGVLAIWDNGPGIPPQDRGRIFDRYEKGSGNMRAPVAGTGLGLAIAKSITQAHGGTISVCDSPTGGARIEARFPLIRAVALP